MNDMDFSNMIIIQQWYCSISSRRSAKTVWELRGSMDIKHFYVEAGKGDPIILLHGNGENCDYFKGQIDEFAKYYHVYAIDTRGHGKTPRGDKPFTIRQFAADLLCFMNDHQIEKTNLLGFSDGGNISMIFAIQHPERVNRLMYS